jgi:hypothetical protein
MRCEMSSPGPFPRATHRHGVANINRDQIVRERRRTLAISLSRTLVVATGSTTGSFSRSGISPRQRRPYSQVLHHALVSVLDNMAMQHEISDEPFVARSQHRLIAALQRHAVAPLTGKARIVRIAPRASGVDDVQVIGVPDRDDLERVDMDVEIRKARPAGLEPATLGLEGCVPVPELAAFQQVARTATRTCHAVDRPRVSRE